MPGIRPIEFDRDEALVAAMDAFWEGGYAQTSLPRLMEATGVARQSLYNTFGDKHSLFVEAIGHYSDVRIAEHHRALGQDPPLETLMAFVGQWRHRRRQTRGRGCLACVAAMELGQRDPKIARVVAQHTARLTAVFSASLLRAGVPDPDDVAASLVCSHFGIGMLSRSAGTQPLIEAATTAAQRMIQERASAGCTPRG